MFSVQSLFALSSVAFLAFGFVLSKVPEAGITLAISGHRGYGFGSQTPLYLIGALFGLFAFLYSIAYIPYSSTMARWHCALSIIGVLLVIIGWSLFVSEFANINLIGTIHRCWSIGFPIRTDLVCCRHDTGVGASS